MTWWAVVNNQNDTVSAIYQSHHHPGELPVTCPAGSRAVKMSDRNSADVGWICLDDVFYDGRPSPQDIEMRLRYLQRYNEARKGGELIISTEKIQELEDLIALDLATEAQKASLLPWRRYRMELRKMQDNTTATLDWPESPDEEAEANETDIEPIVT